MSPSQFLAALRARRYAALLVLLITLLLVIAVSLLLPKKYTASASLVVDVKPDPISGALLANGLSSAVIATQVDILQSERVARRVVEKLKLANDPDTQAKWQQATKGQGNIDEWLAAGLLKHLDVKPSRESNVISVAYQAPEREQAARLANAFVDAYLDIALELRVEPARQYSAFFEKRREDARGNLERAQAKLSELQRENGVVAGDERIDIETARLNELSSQVVALQAVAADSSSRSQQVRGGKADKLNEVLSNPVLSNLKLDVSRAEAALQELTSRLGDNHPQVVQARANLNEMRTRLEQETARVTGSVGVQADINNARLADVRGQLVAQRAKLLKLKDGRDAMSLVQREVDNAQRAYDAIAARQDQSSLESQTPQSNANLLSEARPPLDPSSPRLLINGLLGIGLGLLLALTYVLVRELLDRRVRGGEDVIETLGLPILGVLPKPTLGRRQPSQMAQRVIFGRLPLIPGK